jgi:RES domain-containing protein
VASVAWRIIREEHARSAFDGEGARRVGGRFNSRGTRVVYCADSLALAILEVMVHLPSYRAFRNRVAVRITFDAALAETLELGDLPPGWRSTPPAAVTQSIGDAWVGEGRSAVLRLPSVVVPEECNYVLNPAHPDFGRIQIDEPVAVTLDPRLMK